jgi:Lrp/AsnC family leucine-responsive transcriptional regulator
MGRRPALGADRNAEPNGGPNAGANGRDALARRARVRFDAIDLAILEQLQTDSKITNAKLAKNVGISPPSTLERVKKLEQSGIIKRYTAILDPEAVGKPMSAIVSVTLREHGEDRLRAFARAVSGLEEVRSVYHTAGDEDFFLRVVVSDMNQYEDFVVRKLSDIENIGRIRTSFCLSVVKEETAVPLDAVGEHNDD